MPICKEDSGDTTCFQQDNTHAVRKLKMTLAGEELVHDFAPKYLGVILDRSLRYRKYTENVREEVTPRCKVISKRAGSDTGVPLLLYAAHRLSLSYIQSQNSVCQ